jgi:hypothetical protein
MKRRCSTSTSDTVSLLLPAKPIRYPSATRVSTANLIGIFTGNFNRQIFFFLVYNSISLNNKTQYLSFFK